MMNSRVLDRNYTGDIALLDELADQDAMGGWSFSDWLAHRLTLGGDGYFCTISAECAGTISCGG